MKIRVAIIGAGRMGQRHAEAYKMIKDVELIGFADNITKNANRLAKKFKVKSFTINQILSNDTIDAVNVCTPNIDHAKISIKVLNSGKHVLVEKPMAINLADCDKMINAAYKNNVKLMVGQTYRFYPSSIAAKKIIDSGQIGNIGLAQIHGIDPGFIRGQKKMPQWFKKKNSGGGLLFDMVHMVDLLREWFKSEISQVYVPSIDKISKNATAEQMGLVIMKFQNGASASIMAVAPSWGIRDAGIKIIGKMGALHVTYGEEVKVGKETWKQYKFQFKAKSATYEHNLMGFINELSEFIKSIKEDRIPRVSGEDGKKNLAVILAMYESYRLKKLINLKT